MILKKPLLTWAKVGKVCMMGSVVVFLLGYDHETLGLLGAAIAFGYHGGEE